MFRRRTIRWQERHSLQNFSLLLDHSQLGLNLQDLTICFSVPGSDTGDLLTQDESTQMLTTALTKFRSNSERSALSSICLRLHPTTSEPVERSKRGDDLPWHMVWKLAAELFEGCLRSLLVSQVLPKKLDIFSTSIRCSLAIDRLGSVLGLIDLLPIFRELTELHISISHSTERGVDPQGTHRPLTNEHRSSGSSRGVTHISRLLDLCPRISTLTLHWYRLRWHDETPEAEPESQFFHPIAQMTQLRLTHVRLLGIVTDEATLLAFVNNNPTLRSLDMNFVHLHPRRGSFRPFFNRLQVQCAHLEYLHLDDLFEGNLVMSFSGKGTQAHRVTNAPKLDGCNELERIGLEAARRPFAYKVQQGFIMNSAQTYSWDSRQARRFGPPDTVYSQSRAVFCARKLHPRY